jgi:hypothetical protein
MSAATTDFPGRTYPRTLALFDVDGTLTIPRGEVTEDMMNFMKELSKHVVVGIVGGKYFAFNNSTRHPVYHIYASIGLTCDFLH